MVRRFRGIRRSVNRVPPFFRLRKKPARVAYRQSPSTAGTVPGVACGAPESPFRPGSPEPGNQDEDRPAHVLAAVAEVLVLEAVKVVDHEVALGVAGVVAEPGED